MQEIPIEHDYAFTLPLPADLDARLRRWTEDAPGATWDEAGGHITLLRLAGPPALEAVKGALEAACAERNPFPIRLAQVVRAPYWEKPGLEIVMLTGAAPADTAGVQALRDELIQALADHALRLYEAGEFRPHVTLTTGAPKEAAQELEMAARELDLTFTAQEVMLWARTGPEPAQDWHVVERRPLGAPER